MGNSFSIYLHPLHDGDHVVYDGSRHRFHLQLHVAGSFQILQDLCGLLHKVNPEHSIITKASY